MDAADMAFPAESFEHIWSWGVIHHAASTDAIVSEIYRVLAPGGIAHIMVYHKNSLRYYLYGGFHEGILRGKLFKESLCEINESFTDGAIARHFTRTEIKRMFRDFISVECRVFDGEVEAYLPFVGRPLRRIAPSLMKKIDALLLSRFGWFLFVEATK